MVTTVEKVTSHQADPTWRIWDRSRGTFQAEEPQGTATPFSPMVSLWEMVTVPSYCDVTVEGVSDPF